MTMRQGTIFDATLIAAPSPAVTTAAKVHRLPSAAELALGDEEKVALATIRLSEDPTAWLGQAANEWAGSRDESVPDPVLVVSDSLNMSMG